MEKWWISEFRLFNKANLSKPLKDMVGPVGLEPTTNGLWVHCSNQLSYRPFGGIYFLFWRSRIDCVATSLGWRLYSFCWDPKLNPGWWFLFYEVPDRGPGRLICSVVVPGLIRDLRQIYEVLNQLPDNQFRATRKLSVIQETSEMIRAAGVPQFSECLGFDLSYSFTGDIELFTDLF